MVSRYSVISLFTGAGGIDYGLEAAGFGTSIAVEMDAACAETLRANRKWKVLEADLTETSSTDILRIGGLGKREADLLVAGPPCQPFSKANYWRSGRAPALRDRRTNTLDALVRVIDESLPRVILIENVPAFAHKGSGGLRKLLSSLDEINERRRVRYRPRWAVLDCASFGVPQHRNRFFLVAERAGAEFEMPKGSFGTRVEYLTAWDVMHDLDVSATERRELAVGGRWAELLPSIPEGKNYLWHTPKGGGLSLFGWRTKFWTFLLKLAKMLPAWTLQANPGPSSGPFHWENRRLSIREMARLQTFPDELALSGSSFDQRRQLGNAVPPLMAEILGREIRRQFFDDAVERAPRLRPARAKKTARIETTREVPVKYLDLMDDHADHPGTGLGPGAKRRRLARRRA